MTRRATVITCSDRAHADLYEDRSGPILRHGLTTAGFEVDEPIVLPDEASLIQAAIAQATRDGSRVILTTGGTGLGPRDVTVEATEALLSYQIPGICEAVRALGSAKTPLASLSRGLAGVVIDGQRRAFVFNAPGSRGGARDALAVLVPLLTHIVDQLDGADHDMDAPPSAGS